MAIYGRWGQNIQVIRHATLEDVQKMDGRKPDKHDRQRVEDMAYLVVKDLDDGSETLIDMAFMRADGGWKEIADIIATLPSTLAGIKGE